MKKHSKSCKDFKKTTYKASLLDPKGSANRLIKDFSTFLKSFDTNKTKNPSFTRLDFYKSSLFKANLKHPSTAYTSLQKFRETYAKIGKIIKETQPIPQKSLTERFFIPITISKTKEKPEPLSSLRQALKRHKKKTEIKKSDSLNVKRSSSLPKSNLLVSWTYFDSSVIPTNIFENDKSAQFIKYIQSKRKILKPFNSVLLKPY